MRVRVIGALVAWGLVAVTGACAGASEHQAKAPPKRVHAADAADAADGTEASEDERSVKERLAAKMAERRGDTGDLPTVELELERLASGHLVVPLRVEAHTFSFILDTGASTSVITPKTRDALGIAADAGMKVEAAGANGSVDGVRLLNVEAVEVGPRTYRDLSMAVMELGHLESKLGAPVDGILGRNFLARNDVEIDFVTKKLRMYKPGAIDAGTLTVRQMIAVPYGSFPAGLMRIDVQLDGKVDVPAVFDLGAARSVVNWHAARALGVDAKAAEKLPAAASVVGADDRALATSRHTFGRLATGDLRVERPELHIADLEVFATLGVADGPAMVFGLDLVDDRRLVIDYADQKIYVSPHEGV